MKLSIRFRLDKLANLLIATALVGSNAVVVLGVPLYQAYRLLAAITLPLLTLVYLRDWLTDRGLLRVYFGVVFWWLLYSITSLLWAPDYFAGLKYVGHLAAGFLLSLVVASRAMRKIKEVISVLLGVYSIGLVIGLLETLDLVNIRLSTSPEFQPIGAFSLFGYNEFAFLSGVTMPFVLTYGSRWHSWFFWVISLLTVWCLLNTGSVIGIIVLCIELIVMLIRLPRTSKPALCSIGLLSIVVMGVLAFPHLEERVLRQYVNVYTLWQQGEAFTSERAELFLVDCNLVYQSALLGVGAAGDTYYILRSGGPGNSHNWFMEVLANFGLPVFAPYLSFWVLMLYRLWQFYRTSSGPLNDIAFAAFIVGALMPLSGMMSSSLLRQNSFWVVTGVIIGLASYSTRGELQ